MTTISAKVIEHSVNQFGQTLVTFEATYPRFIHAEVLTHRALSRNAASSRAIPVEKAIQHVIDNPAVPLWWGANQPGMQADNEVVEKQASESAWLVGRDHAVGVARMLHGLGLHKQIASRVIEPYSHITAVITATERANLYALRNDPAAEPHFQLLAKAMLAAERASPLRLLLAPAKDEPVTGASCHLPYVMASEYTRFSIRDLLKFSTARCARVSFLNHDQTNPVAEKDIALHDKLVASRPLHASPAEHQAWPMPLEDQESGRWSGNFRGFFQHRKFLAHECVAVYEELGKPLMGAPAAGNGPGTLRKALGLPEAA